MFDQESEEDKSTSASLPSIEHLYSQIEEVPQLLNNAMVIDQTILQRFHSIQKEADEIIQGFDQQKEAILKKTDHWLFPITQEVLEEMSGKTTQLKQDLDTLIEHIGEVNQDDWRRHAASWVQLYKKWHDKKDLNRKVLEIASERTSQLIDKDIKVIHDYKDHFLSHLTNETENFQQLENRLKSAIEEPYKRLIALKKSPEILSTTQVSEWMASLHEKREHYFDQLLMKIDSVMKESTYAHHVPAETDPSINEELEGELAFIEQEVHQMQQALNHLNSKNQTEVENMKSQIIGLREHLVQFDFSQVYEDLKTRHDIIQEFIQVALERLEA